MNYREIGIFVPLVVLTLLFGFWPKPVLDMSVGLRSMRWSRSIRRRSGKTRQAEADRRIPGETK
jgi:NADH:ubiquinone oxidoreductase subunit 4 (subunit M)